MKYNKLYIIKFLFNIYYMYSINTKIKFDKK